MVESNTTVQNSIQDLVDPKIYEAISTFIAADDKQTLVAAANVIAGVFGSEEPFFSSGAPKNHEKLITSFHKNLMLLIQKTWVESSDAELKEQVLFQLEEFCGGLRTKSWKESYLSFLEILDNVVYLMFGSQSKSNDFTEYAMRIDPEFGIFWLYCQNLPRESSWPDAKYRIAVFLGMYFLANY
ncbi:MAG: hypothetical protein LKF96_11305 [Treponema sp.]|jgi:hypothetical protein|nr:hypothetical protein [Treponema sp.]